MRAGEAIGSYVVVRELGQGGMGTVYLAQHTALGRRAAIKVLQPELCSNQQMLTRFFNEARAASAIKSPGIVEIYDFGRHVDGSAYIVMELLEGEPLAGRLGRLRRLPLGQALVIARQIASALAPAHRAGIVHRDLKPDNVFLVPDAEVAGGERVKLLDFGIAKLLGDGEPGGPGRLTTTKTVMGTPHYMSPEQCRGAGQVDERSDLYALGCILHELISGAPPFVGEGAGDLIGAHIYLAPRRLAEAMPGVPAEVEELVQRLLAKSAAQRPQSAEEVAAALSSLAGRHGVAPAPSSAGGLVQALPLTEVRAGTPMAGMMAPRPRRTERMERSSKRLAIGAVAALLLAVGIYAVAQAGRGAGAPALTASASDLVDARSKAAAPRGDAATATADASPTSAAEGGSPESPAPPVLGSEASSSAPADAPSVPIHDDARVKRRRAECAQLQAQEMWAALDHCAGELRAAVGITPDDLAAADDFSRQAGIEVIAKAQLEKFLAAKKGDDMRDLAAIARGFNKGSMYARQVQDKWEEEKVKYISSKMSHARSAARNGKCGELRGLASSVRPYDARSADEIVDLSCAQPAAAPEVNCNDPEVAAEANKAYEEIQTARLYNHKWTIRMVESALTNRCLADRKPALLRIGLNAACSENRPDKVNFFFLKSGKDEALRSVCPDMLGAPNK